MRGAAEIQGGLAVISLRANSHYVLSDIQKPKLLFLGTTLIQSCQMTSLGTFFLFCLFFPYLHLTYSSVTLLVLPEYACS